MLSTLVGEIKSQRADFFAIADLKSEDGLGKERNMIYSVRNGIRVIYLIQRVKRV